MMLAYSSVDSAPAVLSKGGRAVCLRCGTVLPDAQQVYLLRGGRKRGTHTVSWVLRCRATRGVCRRTVLPTWRRPAAAAGVPSGRPRTPTHAKQWRARAGSTPFLRGVKQSIHVAHLPRAAGSSAAGRHRQTPENMSAGMRRRPDFRQPRGGQEVVWPRGRVRVWWGTICNLNAEPSWPILRRRGQTGRLPVSHTCCKRVRTGAGRGHWQVPCSHASTHDHIATAVAERRRPEHVRGDLYSVVFCPARARMPASAGFISVCAQVEMPALEECRPAPQLGSVQVVSGTPAASRTHSQAAHRGDFSFHAFDTRAEAYTV